MNGYPVIEPLQILHHEDEITSVVFSKDGAQVLTGSRDHKARLWIATTGEMVTEYAGHQGPIARASFSPDEKRVLTYSYDAYTRYPYISPSGEKVVSSRSHRYGDHTARIWNAATGETLLKLTHGKQVSDALFSPDGKQVLLTSLDNSAMLYDSFDGKLLHTLSGHTAGIEAAAFSSDSKRILTSSSGETYQIRLTPNGGGGAVSSSHEPIIARIWDAASGRQVLGLDNQAKSGLAKLIGNASGNSQCKAWFSPDGTKIVTASSALQNTAIWDAASGEVIAQLKGHRHFVNWAAFSPDGSQVVTASADATARVYDAESGRRPFC